jgi:hypothetical protein
MFRININIPVSIALASMNIIKPQIVMPWMIQKSLYGFDYDDVVLS